MRYQLKPEPLPALLRSFFWDAAVSLQSLDRGSCACCGDSGSIALAPAVEVIGLSSHLATWKRMLCSRDLLYRIKPDFVLFSQSALWCGLSTPCFKCAFLEHLPCWVLKGERGVELQCQLFTFLVRFDHKEINLNVLLQFEQFFYCQWMYIYSSMSLLNLTHGK